MFPHFWDSVTLVSSLVYIFSLSPLILQILINLGPDKMTHLPGNL